MTQANEDKRTSFETADLILRQRVDSYNAALQSHAASRVDVKDDLLTQFSREVGNMQSQLDKVEKAFGKNDPMARILREALESAKSRLETRKIELGVDKKEDEAKQKAEKKPAAAPVFTRKEEEPANRSSALGWAAAYVLLNNNNRKPGMAGFGNF